MSTIFDEIEDLELLGVEAKLPYSPAQLVNFATDILMRSMAFEPTLILWNARPAVEKTWTNLKTQFENAHKALRLVRGKTMQDTNFHQANHMATQKSQTDITTVILFSLSDPAALLCIYNNKQPLTLTVTPYPL